MKTYRNLFVQMLDSEVIEFCIKRASKGKHKRKAVQRVLNNIDKTIQDIIKIITDPFFIPRKTIPHIIKDKNNGKDRAIEKPAFFPEQIIHHLIIYPFEEVLFHGMYEQIYGCLPKYKGHNFGMHSAIKQLQKWLQTGKELYVVEADIHHAYASVDIKILKEQLKKVIKDEQWLRLCEKILCNEQGLSLGYYISPWFFNFYLKNFDHFVAKYSNIKYLRFADNLFLVSSDKEKLKKCLEDIKEYLQDNLKLQLNKQTQLFRFEYSFHKGRAVNSVGVIIHNNRICLRKRLLRKTRRKITKVKKKKKITWHDGASILSRLAWIFFTDTYQYYKKYLNINIRALKNKISKHSKSIMHSHE